MNASIIHDEANPSFLKFHSLIRTMMTCPDIEVEDRVINSLNATVSFGALADGAVGFYDAENNLVLVGRLKETIVLSSGENVEPVPIEEAILLSPYIDQIVLVGQDQNGVGALIVPSKEALEKCGISMKNVQSYKDLANSNLEDLIKKEINTHIVNKPNLRVFEKVKQFALLNESFSVENGLMSATQKVKRNKVFEKYEEVIGKMYNK